MRDGRFLTVAVGVLVLSWVAGCTVSSPPAPERKMRGDCMCSTCFVEPFCQLPSAFPGEENFIIDADRCRELEEAGEPVQIAERVFPVTGRGPLQRRESFTDTDGHGLQALWCLRPAEKRFHTIEDLETPGCLPPDAGMRPSGLHGGGRSGVR